MQLRPGSREEYERRHNPVWPEMLEALKRHGVENYSIFHDPRTDTLFAYVEVESEESWRSIAETEECRRWWSYMKDLMLTNPDDSPRAEDLEEVFHLD